MDKKVREFMYYGFVATFMSNCFWEYAALRQMHHLKEKYFARILMQEQGWFDKNNAYELHCDFYCWINNSVFLKLEINFDYFKR